MGEPTQIVHGKYEATNSGDTERMLSYYSPDAVKEVPGATLRGHDEIAAFVSMFREAFPDLRLSIVSTVEEGQVAAVRVRMTGSHTGVFRTPAGDLSPSGRRVDMTFSDDFRIEGGLIISSHLYLDRLELLEQLGALPAPSVA